jgi:dienelactone hydrolase
MTGRAGRSARRPGLHAARRATPRALAGRLVLGLLGGLAGATAAGGAWAQVPQRVSVPSLDIQHGSSVLLAGHWFPVETSSRIHPAVVLLHGCSGAYDGRGELAPRLRDYAGLLNREGWHVLALDSLGARGVPELCTQRPAARTVTQAHRRKDALGALQWLAARPEVDPERLALLGWSNGGSTVLAATNLRIGDVAAAPAVPRAAVAFYPGCEAELRRGYEAAVPLLMLLGGSDDWTPPQPCRDLAAAAATQGGQQVQQVTYDGAGHGFDTLAPVRLRRDVPGGSRPGEGVHVGGHPAARAASREQLLVFLREQLQ